MPDDNLAYPVLITHEEGSASGFYVNTGKNTYLVSAKHVISKLTKFAELLSYSKNPSDKRSNILRLDMELLRVTNNVMAHDSQDVAIIRIAKNVPDNRIQMLNGVTLRQSAESGILAASFHDVIKTYDQVLVGNEVYIFGYPTSIGMKNIPQIDYDKPLLRKGIVAGKNDKNKTIILDCPVYYGNSGGPVVEVEKESFAELRFNIIGVISELIPFQGGWSISYSDYSVISPMDAVIELIEEFENKQ